ncbi:MAG: hypothetical protein U1E53_11360 [Dongiaceae bacterium]
MLELFHPRVHDLFAIDLQRWMVVHYLQIPLFLLVPLAVCLLIQEARGVPAGLCRVAMLVFAVCFVAFDTAAGVVIGRLLLEAQASGDPDRWREPILALWRDPVIGGSGVPAPLLVSLGKLGWLVGCAAAAIVLRQQGASLAVAGLLVVSGLGLYAFMTHAWPGGPVTFGALALAALIVERRALTPRA